MPYGFNDDRSKFEINEIGINNIIIQEKIAHKETSMYSGSEGSVRVDYDWDDNINDFYVFPLGIITVVPYSSYEGLIVTGVEFYSIHSISVHIKNESGGIIPNPGVKVEVVFMKIPKN